MARNLSISSTISLAAGTIALQKAIIDWRNFIREMMIDELEKAPRMGGPGQIVEIDESLFRGRRKYNRGRMLQADGVPFQMPKNHRQRTEGPWVFGLLHQATDNWPT